MFTIASAFRRDCLLITTEITSTLQAWSNSDSDKLTKDIPTATKDHVTNFAGDSLEFDDIYNLIFSCTFFIVIILLPIGLVCIMYWNIFSEARQNGLRMRQNGSSPLLQSALNLATASSHVAASIPPVLGRKVCNVIDEEAAGDAVDGEKALMQIVVKNNDNKNEQHRSCLVKVHKNGGKREPYHYSNRFLEIPKPNNPNRLTGIIDEAAFDDKSQHLASSTDEVSDCEPEPSVRQLLSTKHSTFATDVPEPGELRQVHSTPDLQKLSDFDLSKNKVSNGMKNRSTGSILPVQPPSICTPPKALSYMSSIRHRLSNASSIFKYREESRAARISVLVVIMLLVSYFPYGVLVLLQGRVTIIANSSLFGVLFLLIANMSSPFIFAYRNRRVRRGVCRLFGMDSKTNERLQKQRALLRHSTNSCGMGNGGGSIKQKTKIVRINRNSTKSANITLHQNAMADKVAAVNVPLMVDDGKSKMAPDNGVVTTNESVCLDIDSSEQPIQSHEESILGFPMQENNKLEFSLETAENKLISNVNDIDTNNKNYRFIQNLTNNNNLNCINNNNISTNDIIDNSNVVKEKISFLKRMCKTSRKLSTCTTESCEKIHKPNLCKPISV